MKKAKRLCYIYHVTQSLNHTIIEFNDRKSRDLREIVDENIFFPVIKKSYASYDFFINDFLIDDFSDEVVIKNKDFEYQKMPLKYLPRKDLYVVKNPSRIKEVIITTRKRVKKHFTPSINNITFIDKNVRIRYYKFRIWYARSKDVLYTGNIHV